MNVNYMKLFQDKYNDKYKKNVIYLGSINAYKHGSDYLISINLTVSEENKIIYIYRKDFIKTNTENKTISMDNWHFIDIMSHIDELIYNTVNNP